MVNNVSKTERREPSATPHQRTPAPQRHEAPAVRMSGAPTPNFCSLPVRYRGGWNGHPCSPSPGCIFYGLCPNTPTSAMCYP